MSRIANALSDDDVTPRITPVVQWVIALNVAIAFLQKSVVSDADMFRVLGFTAGPLSQSWWQAITYMFVHASLLHLGLNMWTLWLFGRRVEHAWGSMAFASYYLWCGLGGWLVHFVFVPSGATLIGASAAVFGVMLAYATRWPDDEVLLFGVIPLRIKWLVVSLFGFNLVSGILATVGSGLPGSADGGGVAYLAHVGGLMFGWLYLWTQSSPGIDRLRQRVAQVSDVSEETTRAVPRSLPRARERGNEVDEVVARSKAAVAKQPVPVPSGRSAANQRAEALNHVLDKISAEGIESLTSDERRLLEDLSKQLRGD